jgi:hypothetical protein
MKKTAEEIVNEYISFATIEGETKLTGDYQKGNKMSKKLSKIFDKLKQDNALAENVINSLLKSNSERAKSLAAVDALRLGIFISEAIAILEEVSSSRQDILGFGCEMALKIYRGEIPGKTL